VSYQVNCEIQALDQTAGFLRDDPIGVAALWDAVGQLAGEPRPPESFSLRVARLPYPRLSGKDKGVARLEGLSDLGS
jgi:hypothetical protein